MRGRQWFIFKVVFAFVIIVIALQVIQVCSDATIARFGSWGWVHLVVGILLCVASAVVFWATGVTWLDRRNLRAYRASGDESFSDGQHVALSGCVRTDQEPLQAPFSGQECAAYAYQASGQRRSRSSNSTGYVQQLCMLGFAMVPARLDCGSRQFPLHAMPYADDDLRTISQGGDWGDIGLEQINAAAESMEPTPEEDARGQLTEVNGVTRAPISKSFYVAPTQTSANQISVILDVLPLNTPVTLLATYCGPRKSLEGNRRGGMKVFAGSMDECLKTLDYDFGKGLKLSAPLAATGVALLTLAWWLPG
ncbi:hypothetical protein QWI17_17505 [Gilvimarinus sp. SDUM040013]|uniref:Uncharacterized protein n=1 Tax=Gilvimarinus gilvus TaxID=3058038 RepID=A0ABU4RVN1_9GAMM|nr:hypothetical protein [Gilvimarinus sp. SDUM040013]MDO3387644.1 hypothetical protein [Gilvimarinus sp. SDUM040013]MDX6848915.1 hypothetical protein [Gilvimarinus sp. SDUM040013]